MDDLLPTSPFYRFAHALLSADAGGVTVRQLLTERAPISSGERLRIHFPGGRIEPPMADCAPLAEAISQHDAVYPQYLAKAGVAEFCVVATRGPRGGLRYIAETIDDRGRSVGAQVVFGNPATAAS